MMVAEEMEQQPGALPWSKPWLEDLPGGTIYIPGVDGLADRVLQVPEDDDEYAGTEEDFERDFGGVQEPPPADPGGDAPPSGDPGEGGDPEVAGPPLPAGSEIVYYIYSFDGKLLAEYDADGNCNRDYIYAGNRLIAEHKPKVGIYHFYTPDQINTTRMITDQAGKIVYSAAFGPYGGEQITWVDKCNPALKFSGKERDRDTTFDYFGARHYASSQGRWISPDPIRNKQLAIWTPQLWNLYSYCRNNPITFVDPDGSLEDQQGPVDPEWQGPELPEVLTDQIPRDVRAQMAAAIHDSDSPTGDDKKGGFHEESGVAGRNLSGEWVVSRDKPGPYGDPDEVDTLHPSREPLNVDERNSIVNPIVFFHVHPSGRTKKGNVWVQEPSVADTAAAIPGTINIVFGARNKKAYYYNRWTLIGEPMRR
ncbi:MAG: RHS repeat-associated core domain-containing protein [Acidobacteriota bacterium]